MAICTGGSVSSRLRSINFNAFTGTTGLPGGVVASFFASAAADMRASRRPSVPTIVIDSAVNSTRTPPRAYRVLSTSVANMVRRINLRRSAAATS